MTARFARFAAAAALVAALPFTASAQFAKGDRVASVSFMTGGDYDGTGFGGQAEWGILPLGKATLGIGAFAGFQRDSESAGSFKATSTIIPMMVIGNVHFPIASQPKLDLYAGASVGLIRVSVDVDGGSAINGNASNTDSGFGIQGGARYWMGSKLGLNGQLGFGDIPLIQAGVSFKF
jgi:hypothetical protein